jgi:hypothetical protein
VKTVKVTLVLEGIGDGKIRCSASPWADAKVILDGQVLEVRAQQEQAAMGAAEAPPAGPRREEEVSSMFVAVCALPAPSPGRGPSSGPNLPTQSWLLQCSIPTGRQHPSCRDKMASDVAYCQPSQLI